MTGRGRFQRRRLPTLREIQMAASYQAGYNCAEIGQLHGGISHQRVQQILDRRFPELPRHQRGSLPKLESRLLRERCAWARELIEVVPLSMLREFFELPKWLAVRRVDEKPTSPVYAFPTQERILNLWNSGGTYKQIREHLAVTNNHISAALGRFRVRGKNVRRGYPVK